MGSSQHEVAARRLICTRIDPRIEAPEASGVEDEDEIFVLHAPIWCLTRAFLVHPPQIHQAVSVGDRRNWRRVVLGVVSRLDPSLTLTRMQYPAIVGKAG